MYQGQGLAWGDQAASGVGRRGGGRFLGIQAGGLGSGGMKS